MSKDKNAVKLANIIRNSELHNRSTLDMDELYEEVADIVKDIRDAGFRDITDLKDWLEEERDKLWLKYNTPSMKEKLQEILDKLESL